MGGMQFNFQQFLLSCWDPVANDWEQPDWLEYVKFTWCTLFVTFSVIVIIAAVSLTYCTLQLFPLVNFILLIGALILLGYCEALHYGCVSLEKWDMSAFAAKFPRAKKCHELAPNPEEVKKFLVGRQFFTIFVVFLISEITTFPYVPKTWLGAPRGFILAFIQTGIPGVMLVLTFGQLIPQLFVEEYTLPFMNLYGCNFVIRLSLFAEWIGVCSYSWLLYNIVSMIFCRSIQQAALDSAAGNFDKLPATPSEANVAKSGYSLETSSPAAEDPFAGQKREPYNWFDFLKFCWSTWFTFIAMFLLVTGIARNYSTLPTPVAAKYIIFIVDLTILFYLEGTMICIVATQFWDRESFKDAYPRAYRLHQLVNKPENVKRFIVGRQFFTVLSNFLLSQIAVMAFWPSKGYDPTGFFIVVKSGLIGVLIILAHGQLCPELLAAEYPLRFMNMFGSYTIVRISLFIEAIGIGHCAWFIYFATRGLCCSGVNLEDIRPGVLRVNSQEVLIAEPTK